MTGGFDIEDFGGDNVRVPAVGNLPISNVSGNAVCCAGPTLPCFVGPPASVAVVPAAVTGCGDLPLPGAATAGLVSFRQNQYVVQPNDPNPLPDQGNITGNDLCNSGVVGCSSGGVTIQFTASTELESGCTNQSKEDSTPCSDTDGNACTHAGCEQGICVQTHIPTVCVPDDNECTNDLECDPATGLCPHPPKEDSTPCTDSDGNACTMAGCDAGVCNQDHVVTNCPPSDNECVTNPGCNPETGACDHPPKPDSTPCTDSDNDLCTMAGCDAGVCNQSHVETNCPPDTNPCTMDPACNPQTGMCEHPPEPDSTPCPDTDNLACTTAGCEMGTCVQMHISTCQGFTRTVGLWKNHPALTKIILDQAGGLTVCGESITNVAIDDAKSALEAMCGSANGNFEFQCCRQLTAASLNGAAGGAVFADLAHCNDVCGDPNSSKADVNACNTEATDFNQSGDNLDLPFPPGPAKSGPCQKAADTTCEIVEPQESSCAAQ